MAHAGRSHRNNVRAARQLRRPLTPTERLLWEHLRDRRLDGLKFRRQHPVGPFVLDFYCVELRLAIEVDGGVHSTEEQAHHDADRQAVLEEAGIRFIRIPAADIEADLEAVITRLLIHMQPDRTS
ncbi:MAG: endonuclease domain-containing protein [Dehalococcoidia bacterium]